MTHNKREAAQLETAARAIGFVAAKAGSGNWVEIRTTLAGVRRAIIDHPSIFVDARTLWEPQTRTLERLDRRD